MQTTEQKMNSLREKVMQEYGIDAETATRVIRKALNVMAEEIEDIKMAEEHNQRLQWG